MSLLPKLWLLFFLDCEMSKGFNDSIPINLYKVIRVKSTSPTPFTWASNPISHIQDGLPTISQTSHINMKIEIIKGGMLLK
jgi:hypothetical protein